MVQALLELIRLKSPTPHPPKLEAKKGSIFNIKKCLFEL